MTSDLRALGLEEGRFDFIYAASFFHLFDYDTTVKVMRRAVKLLKHQPGSMIFGRQTGTEVPGVLDTPKSYNGRMYRQSPDSFRDMVEEVVSQATGVKLECDVHVERDLKREEGGRWLLLRFAIVVK